MGRRIIGFRWSKVINILNFCSTRVSLYVSALRHDIKTMRGAKTSSFSFILNEEENKKQNREMENTMICKLASQTESSTILRLTIVTVKNSLTFCLDFAFRFKVVLYIYKYFFSAVLLNTFSFSYPRLFCHHRRRQFNDATIQAQPRHQENHGT